MFWLSTVRRDGRHVTPLPAMWLDKLDWSFEVVDGRFRYGQGGGQQAVVFAVAPVEVLAFPKAGHSVTVSRVTNRRSAS